MKTQNRIHLSSFAGVRGRFLPVVASCVLLGAGLATPPLIRAAEATATLANRMTVAGRLEGPAGYLAGCNITMFSADGRTVLAKSADPTSPTGFFLVTAPNLPRDFVLVATGGPLGQTAFSSVVTDYDFTLGFVYIDPATTLVAHQLKLHPKRPLNTVERSVESFLGLPPQDSTHAELATSEHDLGLRIAGLARNFGTMDGFMQRLESSLDNGDKGPSGQAASGASDNRSPMVASSGLTGLLDTDKIVGDILSGLKGAALGKGKELALGWILQRFGIDNRSGTDKALDEIRDTLDAVNGKLDELKSSVSSMHTELAGLIKQGQYDAWYSDTEKLANNIRVYEQTLRDIVAADPLKDQDWIAKRKATVSTGIERDLFTNFAQIHQGLVGTGGRSAVMKLYPSIVKAQKKFWSREQYRKVQAWYDYYDLLQAAHLALLVNYENAQGTPEAVVNKLIQQFETQRAMQKRLLLPEPAEHEVIDRDSKLVWFTQRQGNGVTVSKSNFVYDQGSRAYALKVPPYTDKLNPSDRTAWRIPNKDEASSLASGYVQDPSTGINTLADWLKTQSGADSQDAFGSPTPYASNPFFGFADLRNQVSPGTYGFVLTSDFAYRKWTEFPKDYIGYFVWVMSLDASTVHHAVYEATIQQEQVSRSAATGETRYTVIHDGVVFAYVFYCRNLRAGEQYWYDSFTN